MFKLTFILISSWSTYFTLSSSGIVLTTVLDSFSRLTVHGSIDTFSVRRIVSHVPSVVNRILYLLMYHVASRNITSIRLI